MNRLSASFAGLISLSALLVACSGGSSEATTPQASAEPTASATPPVVTATASAAVAPVPSATAIADTKPAPEPAADLKVVAMKMTLPKGGSLEVKADGTLWANKTGAKPAQIGNFAKNALNITDGKAGTIAVWKDNTITVPDSTKKISFDDKDTLLVDGGKITVDDKGKVDLTKPDGSKETKVAVPTITGFKPEARRAALLLTALYLMQTGEPQVSGPTVTTGAGGCDDAKKPAACPGGGMPKCDAGKWSCPPLPHQ